MTIQPCTYQTYLTLMRYSFPSYPTGPRTWRYGGQTLVTGFYQSEININEQGQMSFEYDDMDDDGDMYITDEFTPEMIGPIEPFVQGPHFPPLQGPHTNIFSWDLFNSDDLNWSTESYSDSLVEDFFNMDEFGLVPTT